MTLTKIGYRPRIVDAQISRSLRTFGAISLDGPRWCGKTWTALNHANSVSYLMDANTRTLAEIDPLTALSGESPHAVDEWQEVPAIWDAARFAVDQDKKRGRFLLTGSVTRPEEGVSHSGIGRISRMRMRTMTLFESGDSSGAISLKAILCGEKPMAGKSDLDIRGVIDMACRGGWPASLDAEAENPFAIPFDYLDSIVSNDVPERKTVREVSKFRYFLASLARNNATIVKNSTLHNDVQSAAGEFSANTLAAYLQVLQELFVLEEIPGWAPRIRSKARVLSSPKRMFADPSLAVAALGATPEKLMSDLQAFGGIFEGLCLRDLLVYAGASDARVFHYRDNSGLEVDAILENRDGSWGGFEIKLGGKETLNGVKSLLRLKEKIEKDGGEPPGCLAVLTGAQLAMSREDGVLVIPISMLRD
jgi:predicted AAA+ superfamily ATPase